LETMYFGLKIKNKKHGGSRVDIERPIFAHLSILNYLTFN